MKENQTQAGFLEGGIHEHLRAIEKTIANALKRLPGKAENGFLSLKNAAAYSDLSEKTLRRFISMNRLQAYRPARGKILIKRKELDALIESSTKKLRKGRGIRH